MKYSYIASFAVISAIATHIIQPLVQTEAKKTPIDVQQIEKINKANANVWTQATKEKQNTLVNLWMESSLAKSLINTCKATALDPAHCVKIWASILAAESSLGKKCHKNNCAGIADWKIGYESKEDGIKDWVKRYNKYWYKQKNPDGFYSNTPKRIPATRYCMWGSAGYCKHGHKNAWAMWEKMSKF